MDVEAKLVCYDCGKSYPVDDIRWRCDCGGVLDIDFQPAIDFAAITAAGDGLACYRSVLPLDSTTEIISLGESLTALVPVSIDSREILIKQDHLFPTGSFKDRGAAVLLSQIKSLGIDRIVEDSSGNAGAAIAAYSAAAEIACDIYVPDSTSPAKLAQIAAYGATLHKVPGNREDTAAAAQQAESTGFYASHCWNPFFLQGVKTFAYEVVEQLEGKIPDTLVLPTGNGTLLLGAYIGFRELQAAWIIADLPRLIAVQTENCAPLFHEYHDDSNKIGSSSVQTTIAEGIAVARPIRGRQIIDAVRRSQGDFITVSETEIDAALNEILRRGFYIEPTAAAAIAGVRKYLQHAGRDELIVTAFTGHGLKAGAKIGIKH
jgi:threonine synthase